MAESAVRSRLLARKIVCNGRQSCLAARPAWLPASRFDYPRAFNTLYRLQNVWNSLHDDKYDCIFDLWAHDCPRSFAFFTGSSRLRAKRSGEPGEDAATAIYRCASSDRSAKNAGGRYRHDTGEPGYGHDRA
jgi:hypothetical protein